MCTYLFFVRRKAIHGIILVIQGYLEDQKVNFKVKKIKNMILKKQK